MSFASASNIEARDIAYAASEKLKPEATSVVEYQSRGQVVVIGDTQALKNLGELPKNLSKAVLEYKGQSPKSDISIEGALGQFVVTIADQEIKADLVLDLTPEPLLSMGLKPPGYFTANPNENLQSIKDELAELVGTFEKPKYFDYDPSTCAHGRSGKPGCTRCIDACPAEAITSLIDTIKVDASRCQGGGVCATVCPSGAITYAYPKPKDLLTHVRTLILTYLKAGLPNGVLKPDLIFVTENERTQVEQILPAALIIMVEEVASVGPEVWLSALAWGAQAVRLFDIGDGEGNDLMPLSSRGALDHNIEMVQTVLVAANYPASAITVVTNLGELLTSATMPEFDLATHAPITGKRQAFYMALDHLVAKSEDAKASTPLPEGSIFGEVSVDKESCTLCMACVSACPANALQAGNEKPMLSLVETNCLQCGVCVNTCPESAMTLSPRILLDFEVRKKPRVLNEEEPFCCISCGKPFATKSSITTILEKLSGHSMFADDRSKNRLKMCEDCRVRDMMEDPDVDF